MHGISFRAHKDDEVEVRTESYLGKDYLVVPVVALVEGVLQGMNAAYPELALAEEFGRVPAGWNGRPVVMNHPVLNGQAVSANSPVVLEAYAFGYMFNTRLEDAKLKSEAWIDIDRANALGGEFESTLKRIQEGKVVEVSTGLFTGVEKVEGKFNGKAYKAVWKGVVPDHLALLSDGVKGACSVEDGCGTPRVNAESTDSWAEYSLQTTGSCSCGCGTCGGDKMSDNHDHSHDHDDATTTADPTATTVSADAVDGTGNVSADDAVSQNASGAVAPSFQAERFLANTIPDGLTDNNVRMLLQESVRASATGKYAYVMAYTQSKVIYERYDDMAGSYCCYQRSFDISAERVVTLSDDEEAVNIFMDVQPKKKAKAEVKAEVSTNQEKTNMSDTNTPQTADTLSAPVVTANAAPATPMTTEQFLASAPAEIRDSLQAGLRLHQQQKDICIKALKDTGRCKFTDDQLKAMSLEQLEALRELAAVPVYDGRATPRLVDNAADNAVPPMPSLFPKAS